jgi:hypothetical protein
MRKEKPKLKATIKRFKRRKKKQFGIEGFEVKKKKFVNL